ncbi:craniofacial development protein 1-like isoform X2 [Dendronephthya gigantea]|uniref:craniofacial development protein 1-like isoform X2 n=1 Tax=Dendronephthya gigantea TaxID=151771 RepID=UPI00106D86EB|nr:craniofacial development protein 1-like isoform X2 [Dendronephthya gigantea]
MKTIFQRNHPVMKMQEVQKDLKRTKMGKNRKRKGGIQLQEDDEVSANEESDEVENINAEIPVKEDLGLKKRVDDLWEAFKQDTAATRPAASSHMTQKTEEKTEENPSTSSGKKEEIPKKVEVTEVFDFAGEEVKVVKSVDSSSIKPAPVSDKDNPSSVKPRAALPTKRPGGGLGSVLGKIGKKPKLSTLEKSKLDWTSFKKDEGIEDELKTSNRDGFLEKQAFLNRVDQKQFEIERDIRQGFRKK